MPKRLSRYRAKRDFARTSEPAGRPAGGDGDGDLFMVHKHDATRLHYDLRLQIGDVLKSWAVPKGPSLDPGERRLAVEVEFHPLEYGAFEGRHSRRPIRCRADIDLGPRHLGADGRLGPKPQNRDLEISPGGGKVEGRLDPDAV